MSNAPDALVRRFYAAFAAHDADAMAACYHPEVIFVDPVFGRLEGEEARAMWRMLLARATDLVVHLEEVEADEDNGTARAYWDARYTFAATGRPVHNRVEAEFGFRAGLIHAHHDQFGLYRWARMALGPTGVLLGWTPLVQNRIRKQARRSLDQFVAKSAA